MAYVAGRDLRTITKRFLRQMKITGTIVYQDIEGGFWGIVGDDGEHYRPIDGLTDELKQEDLRVEVDLEPVQVLSIAMWGRSVRINAIKPL